MQKSEFLKILSDKVLILDGATGTQLHENGMPGNVSPELWIASNPEKLIKVQQDYIAAGSEVIYSCTFGANRLKLAESNILEGISEINEKLLRISRRAAEKKALVAGCIGPTGHFVEPFGDLPFEEAVKIFKEQAKGQLDGGADLFVIETMIDIQEARAALIAVKEICDLPVIVSMTFSDDGQTLTGSTPEAAIVTLQSLGASAVGCNCSVGPDSMIPIVKKMKAFATVPLLAKPNAGLPKLVGSKTVFDMKAEDFAAFGKDFIKAGANIIGGCCGTSPEFIRKIKASIANIKPIAPLQNSVSALSSSRKAVVIGGDRPITVIGERINPTGKKTLAEELREGKYREVRHFAIEQKEKGADILDVNVGVSGINEKDVLSAVVRLVSPLVDLPLCIDSSDPEAVEKALRIYPGRAMVNSISFEKGRIKKMLPAAAKYGAMFILLPLGDDEVPETAEQRQKYVGKIMKKAEAFGYSKNDVLIDGIVMTISSNQNAAMETLKMIECAAEAGFNTVIGLSNVSFGLPERKWVNSAFLAMAADRGLTAVIANPESEEIMSIKFASDVLMAKDKGCKKYIEKLQSSSTSRAVPPVKKNYTPEQLVYQAVLKGDREHITQLVADAVKAGVKPSEIVDGNLIPAIKKVGDLFDKKEYFLPQLIMSAEAMKSAFDYLEPFLENKHGCGVTQKHKIILATVKGDIHDIGKNIVALMLKNYGFDVIDLGKDVGHAPIIKAAKKTGAKIIGLSALMTTTMIHMREIIDECRNAGLSDVKFIVGGAVLDKSYADEIGADGYAPDSVEAVRLVQKLLNIQ